MQRFREQPLTRVTLYTAGHLHTAVPHCSHSRAPIVHTAVPRKNNEHGCVYLRCRAVCKLPGCVEGHPWLTITIYEYVNLSFEANATYRNAYIKDKSAIPIIFKTRTIKHGKYTKQHEPVIKSSKTIQYLWNIWVFLDT